jgi:hypothetical protein
MNEQLFRYSVYLKLAQRREMPAEIGQKFLDSLDALSAIDPLFTPWKVIDFAAVAKLPLAAARSRIAAIVRRRRRLQRLRPAGARIGLQRDRCDRQFQGIARRKAHGQCWRGVSPKQSDA